MKYISVCSGIEAATCAWHSLGWNPVAFSEIEKFPSQVLAHHYPAVPNLGDMSKFEEWPDATIDLLVGGTPCQSFSVAGLRKGLADPRGNLMLTYGAIARRYRPKWLVWENVPGVLSSNGGRDFGTFLGMLGQLGYGFSYRVLDAQFFGVAQRRRRVFVVGCLGDWRSAAAVLFERHSLSGHPAPSREAGEGTAAGAGAGVDGGSPSGVTIHGTDPTVQKVASYDELAQCLRARTPGNIDNSSTTVVQHPVITMAHGQGGAEIGFDASEDGTGHGQPIVVHGTQDPCTDEHVAFALGRNSGQENAIAFSCKDHGGDAGPLSPTLRSMGHDGSHANAGEQVAVAFQERGRDDGRSLEIGGDVAYALTAPNGGGRAQERNVLTPTMQVRRLTPRECERLQGFPDDYTLIPVGKKMAADGPRYKALGNSMAVPCMTWIGKRIQLVEQIKEKNEVAA